MFYSMFFCKYYYMFDLKKFRVDFNLSQKALAELLGVKQPFVSQMESGKDPFPLPYIAVLSEKYNINIDEYKKNDLDENNDYRLVPLINFDVVGGFGNGDVAITDSEYTIGMIPFTDAREKDICIQVKGDSMVPTCPSGSIVLIREVKEWRNYFGYGNIFCLLLKDGRRILKEVNKFEANSKEFVTCISHNDNVPSEELPKELIARVWKVIKILTDKGF